MSTKNHTIKEDIIDVGNGHKIYAQVWGNIKAKKTIVFLHGGPGAGTSSKSISYFNPEKHKVIFFDQRGSGGSKPYGSIKHNTTHDLIEDINKITKHFGVDKFILTGGSWGSCLALLYAIKYPKKVQQLILRGVYTARQSEDDFIYKGEFKFVFPDVWQEFLDSTPYQELGNPAGYHFDKVLNGTKKEVKESAHVLSKMEGSLMKLDDRPPEEDFANFDPLPSVIFAHYYFNKWFIEEGYILDNAEKLKMPVTIIQGRYDIVCPPITAYALHQRLPNSKLIFVSAGHSGSDRSSWDVYRAILDS